MHARPRRTLIAALASLALVGTMSALPVAGQLTEPECGVTVDGTLTEEVADAVTLTFEAEFVCADAAESGTWSIAVDVTNESDADVSVDEVTLSHVTPSDPGGNELNTTSNLPLELAAGASGDFEAGGTFELSDEDLVNLHLQASGTATAGDEVQPFVLGINVHVLGPGVELDDPADGEDGGEGDEEAEGRPEWAPGPPPWVIEMLRELFGEEFPPGFWAVVNRDAEDGDEEASEAEGSEEDGSGPPGFVTLPPQAGGGDEEGEDADGPPSWVPGPPSWAGDDEEGDGASGPPEGVPGGRP